MPLDIQGTITNSKRDLFNRQAINPHVEHSMTVRTNHAKPSN